VNFTHRHIAALMLFAWLFAGAHLALEHGGVAFCAHLEEAMHGAQHHEHGSGAGDESHHHDFVAMTAAQFAKSAGKQLQAPQWVPIFERLVAELAASLRRADVLHERSIVGDSPPDSRKSGWLFVVQSARPVRGPSLAA
jgi:hypothetical protein